MSTRMKVLGGLALTSLFVAPAAFGGTIVGSAHDFSGNAWSGGEICVVCHTPHNAPNTQFGPLWNRATYTPGAFQMYPSGGTIQGTLDAGPTGESLVCLSCHDGTVAIDSFGGATSPSVFVGDVNANALVGTDLRNDHPISITYNTADTELHPTTNTFTYGNGTTTDNAVSNLLGTGGKVQCSSCHDVHNTKSAPGADQYLLLIDNSATGSDLCLACHNK